MGFLFREGITFIWLFLHVQLNYSIHFFFIIASSDRHTSVTCRHKQRELVRLHTACFHHRSCAVSPPCVLKLIKSLHCCTLKVIFQGRSSLSTPEPSHWQETISGMAPFYVFFYFFFLCGFIFSRPMNPNLPCLREPLIESVICIRKYLLSCSCWIKVCVCVCVCVCV